MMSEPKDKQGKSQLARPWFRDLSFSLPVIICRSSRYVTIGTDGKGLGVLGGGFPLVVDLVLTVRINFRIP